MSASRKGYERERAVKRQLEEGGWVVVRTPASKSSVDLWALRALNPYSRVMAIQVKGNLGSPYKTFGPDERRALSYLAARAGASAWLVHWPPHGTATWLPRDSWP